jgi:hypothetical protein
MSRLIYNFNSLHSTAIAVVVTVKDRAATGSVIARVAATAR